MSLPHPDHGGDGEPRLNQIFWLAEGEAEAPLVRQPCY